MKRHKPKQKPWRRKRTKKKWEYHHHYFAHNRLWAFRIKTQSRWNTFNAEKPKKSASVKRITLIIWCVLSKVFYFWFMWQRRARTEWTPKKCFLQAIIIAMWKMFAAFIVIFFLPSYALRHQKGICQTFKLVPTQMFRWTFLLKKK